MSKREFDKIITFHPGYYIKEIIEDMGITQKEFAKRLGVHDKIISKLVNAEIPLSDNVAAKLSCMFNISPETWLNMQSRYDAKVIEIEGMEKLQKEKEYLKRIDYKFFVNLGVVPDVKKAEEKIKALCLFLKISSLEVLKGKDFLVQYRTVVTKVTEQNIINSNAWVQTAVNMAKEMDCEPFDKVMLKKNISEIRSMTLQEPEVFYPRLEEIFRKCGVAFILLPTLKNSGINGAVKWLSGDKVLLALNNRGLSSDKFWFSLFHEIGHILQQRMKEVFVSGTCEADISGSKNHFEEDADRFARDTLIPEEEYKKFVERRTYMSRDKVKDFADRIKIHPSIVVGRLQHEGDIKHSSLNDLKVNYLIVVKEK